ncbi:MotA/TolQ/ExbB proton channel family protein [Microbulbifer thermotolerans]|uniref:MotA/TolQ/ExbB proton channel family protein n=1 Tax=Microbulbifer thermotolerans TaxID=252514 RepID=A0AB35HUV5_MICTH|nr:MotA/TolQ/ExbB proton channel family protein [Microbulbifer thermotolerans]MCX2782374.1 MotA/TolQ/ExbB proton channel family protein [Microbulbifer thermotolerans]MCX2800527.1 MotA/TolQ/ExbB proton channel family protein [Microbulbifer thermotolerans]MCX2831151.1 MotA/TolQ/ExbB proton channel family protein [Microbulbifer thermotolerans]WKT62204.1 MotA/TolQ/ExbB proton channel family protein [Microbulbifer thermotolerans]SFB85171.1 MotA/TolQ/ExbB proton channel family protein [Microbulbifer
MFSSNLESVLSQVSAVFLAPSLLCIVLALIYTLYAFGALLTDAWLMRKGVRRTELSAYARKAAKHSDDLELFIMRKLELLRLTSRVTPMLGLVATLIPMGPALLALSENDTTSVGSNMVVAFSGVTLALITASLSFVILNIRRRWLFEELRMIEQDSEPSAGGRV